jgi:uncharacterized protein
MATDGVVTLGRFFEEARAGRHTAIRCDACGALAMPPKEFGPQCQKRGWTPVTLAGEGVIVSHTIIRIPPRSHAGEAPYAVAVVRLAEGVQVTGRLVDVPLDSLRSGLPVRFRPFVAGGQTAIGFGPA